MARKPNKQAPSREVVRERYGRSFRRAQLWLDTDTDRALSVAAAELGVDRSDVANEAIALYLERPAGKRPRPRHLPD
jgi:hypothetical protein